MEKKRITNGLGRQGDVGIQAIDALPDNLKPHVPEDKHRIVIAHGEVTGHAHAIYELDDIEMFEDEAGTLYMRNSKDKVIKHEEHAPLEIPAGTHKFIQQREYTPEGIRNVLD